MGSRQHVVSMVVACLAGMAGVFGAAGSESGDPVPRYACRPQVDKDDALLDGGYEHDDRVHFRIAFDPDVDPLQKRAFKAGMKMWNDRSRETGFVFEESTTNAVDFRFQRGARGLPYDAELLVKTDCAGYGSPGSFIWYSPDGMGWVTHERDIAAAARIYAHELGHALNVFHKPGFTSIMRPGDPNVTCRELALTAPPVIPDEDARDAWFCGHGARAKARAQRGASLQ